MAKSPPKRGGDQRPCPCVRVDGPLCRRSRSQALRPSSVRIDGIGTKIRRPIRRTGTGKFPSRTISYAFVRPMPRMAPAVCTSVVAPRRRIASIVHTRLRMEDRLLLVSAVIAFVPCVRQGSRPCRVMPRRWRTVAPPFAPLVRGARRGRVGERVHAQVPWSKRLVLSPVPARGPTGVPRGVRWSASVGPRWSWRRGPGSLVGPVV